MHFSIDDFLMTFQDLTERQSQFESLFEQPVFSFFKRLHDAYGMKISCYCFGEDAKTGFSLKDVTRKYRAEFCENAHWLKFGFHGWNDEAVYGDNRGTRVINRSADEAAEDYAYVTEQLAQIAGAEAIDRIPRIHYFAGTEECCEVWRDAKYGIVGLIAADDDRHSYYHDDEIRNVLQQNDVWRDEEKQLTFYRTHIRLEKEPDLESLREKLLSFEGECQVIFTHEYYLHEKSMQEKIELCARMAAESEG